MSTPSRRLDRKYPVASFASIVTLALLGVAAQAAAADGEAIWADVHLADNPDEGYYRVWGPGAGSPTVYVVGNTGVKRSDDRGRTWTSSMPDTYLRGVWGSSASDVYVIGNRIHHSADGGKTWQELAAPLTAALGKEFPPELDLNSISGGGPHVFALSHHGVVLHSADRGATWGTIRLPARNTYALWSTKGTVFVGGAGGLVLASGDAGKSWRPVRTGTTATLSQLWGISDRDVFAAGKDGTLLHGSKTGPWKTLELPIKGDVAALWGTSARDFYCVVSIKEFDARIAMLVRAGDVILHTRDGGATWTQTRLPEKYMVAALWGPIAGDIYAAAIKGVLHNSPDQDVSPRTEKEVAAAKADEAVVLARAQELHRRNARTPAQVAADEAAEVVASARAAMLRGEEAPEPWRGIRAAVARAGNSYPALSVVLRRALRVRGYDVAQPLTDEMNDWEHDRSRGRVVWVGSCPLSKRVLTAAEASAEALSVEGVTCSEGKVTRSGSSPVHTTTSRVRYSDGQGSYDKITTTQTGGSYEDEHKTWTVSGAFELHFGSEVVRVPFETRESGDGAEEQRAGIFEGIPDVANVELKKARAKVLSRLRAGLSAASESGFSRDEHAAELLLLSDRDEPEAVERLRKSFALPAPAAGDGWSGTK